MIVKILRTKCEYSTFCLVKFEITKKLTEKQRVLQQVRVKFFVDSSACDLLPAIHSSSLERVIIYT